MSDAEDTDQLEAIREKKRQELLEQAGNGEAESSTHHSPSPAEPIHIESQAHLEDVTTQHPIVLVDFYADWCGPCKMLEPTVAEIARETDAAVAKIDIDQLQSVAMEYQVQGVPTLYLFVDGEPLKRLVGVQDKGTLLGLIEQFS